MKHSEAKEIYHQLGHVSVPVVADQSLVLESIDRMNRVLHGEYDTDIPPKRIDWKPGDDPLQIRRIEQPHWSDKTIAELITSSQLGEWASAISGAKMVQIWNVQLLVKPSGNPSYSSNVGWHQDTAYWPMWDGEVFTVWLAISDVAENCGPILYVDESHKWGQLGGSDFWFEGSLDSLKEKLKLPENANWHESPAVLPAGAATFHHPLTLHGSGPNNSGIPRLSFAIHLRTEKAIYNKQADPKQTVTDLDDPTRCPVIWDY